MNSFYNMGERVEVSRPSADAYLVLDSADRSTSSSAVGTVFTVPQTQPYNNFRLQKPENLVQGGFTRLQLNEINFPYAIPNVNPRNNTFWIRTPNPVNPAVFLSAKITVPEGFYDGRGLAETLTGDPNAAPSGLINTDPVIGFAATGITWQVDYLPDSFTHISVNQGGFLITATLAGPVAHPFQLYPMDPAQVGIYPVPAKSLLDVMGFSSLSAWPYITALTAGKSSVYAPMSYTRFIDIASNKLTYYQNVKDGSTSTRSGANVIYRMFIANETSNSGSIGYYYIGDPTQPYDPDLARRYQMVVPPGSQPFVIHRQIMAPKIFNWEKDTAIDWCDIQLFDDAGQPLYVPDEGLPDFQLTFKVSED